MKTKRKVMGVGINDAEYVVVKFEVVEGKRKQVWICPYYQTWKTMLKRCFYEKDLQIRPNYREVSVCDSWLHFSCFKSWMEEQVWYTDGGKLHMDKDILVPDSKIYSPETCKFVPCYINSLFTLRGNHRGQFPLGVVEQGGKYVASVTNKLFNRYLGIYSTPEEAHRAWQLGKAEVIKLTVEKYRTEPFYTAEVERALQNRIDLLLSDHTLNVETKAL